MIECELLSVGKESVTAAMYYVVPADIYSPTSVDPNRVPKGTQLNATELQDLKDGKLFEYLCTITITEGTPIAEVAVALDQAWTDCQEDASTLYNKLFGLATYIGYHRDAGVWGPPE